MEDLVYVQAAAKIRCTKCGDINVVVIDERFFGKGQPHKCPYCEHQMKLRNG